MKTYHIFFKKLAYPLNVSILASLKNGSKSVSELVGDLKIEQSKLSHALKNLLSCNLVAVSREGKKRIYSLNKKTILPIFDLIDKHERCYCKCCAFRERK